MTTPYPANIRTLRRHEVQLGINDLRLPVGTSLLHVDAQDGSTYLYTLEPHEVEVEKRLVVCLYTNSTFQLHGHTYIGTVHTSVHIGARVLYRVMHAFEVRPS